MTLICMTCGGPRSPFSAKQCRACYQSGLKRPRQVGDIGKGAARLDITLTLRADFAKVLTAAADARARQPVEVLVDIIETVLGENLIAAVLDDAVGTSNET